MNRGHVWIGLGLLALAGAVAWGVWHFTSQARETTRELARANDAYTEIKGIGDAITGLF